MKRRELKSRRVRVVLPAMRPALPQDIKPLLKEANDRGNKEAFNYTGSRRLRVEDLYTLHGLIERASVHPGLPHLCRALFLSGLSVELETRLQTKTLVDRVALENLFLTGAMCQTELILTQLQLPTRESAKLFLLPDCIRHLHKEWWMRSCGGALAVTRLAHFLLTEGWQVYLPTPTEDVHWKIDLIAKLPGESISLCFQVKSDQHDRWPRYRIHHTAPNGMDCDATHRFWDGVRRFQKHIHGLYVPVEVTFGSQQFADGAVESRGYFPDALRQMLSDARTKPTLI